MPSKTKFGIVAMCDAVYKDEKSNKAVLAGLYSGDVIVDSFPAELRVAFYIEVIPSEGGDREMDLQFWMGRKHRGGAKVTLAQTVAGEVTMLIVPQYGLVVPEETLFDLRVSLGTGRAVSILKKRILTRPPSAPSA